MEGKLGVMAESCRRKQKQSQKQQTTVRQHQVQQDSLSFSAREGEGRRRKASIGVTLNFSKRHNSPPSSSALNNQGDSRPFSTLLPENCYDFSAEPLKEPGTSPRKLSLNVQRQDSSPSKWTSLDPFNYTDASPKEEIGTAFDFCSCKMIAEEGREFASTRIVGVYANRKSAAGSDKFVEEAFAARSQSAVIRYERRKNTTVVGEIAMQKTQEVKSSKRRIGSHVRFNFDREASPSPDNFGEEKDKKDADGCQGAASLRMKLRSALCLLNSSQKPQDLQENSGKEPKSDTIETDSDEPNQTAKALEPPSVFKRLKSNAKSKQGDSVVETRKFKKGTSPCTSPVENILRSSNAKSKQGDSAWETRKCKKDSSPCTSPAENILRSSNAKSKQGDSAWETRKCKKDSSPCTSPVENILRTSNAKSKQGDSALKRRNSDKDSSPCTSPVESILHSSKAKLKQEDSAVKARKSKKDSSPCASPFENIFSFDQDEWLYDSQTCSRDYKRRSRRSEDNMCVNPSNVLNASPEGKEDPCPAFTVVEEVADHQSPSPPPSSPVLDIPPTEFDEAGKTCNINNESPSTSSVSFKF